MAERPSLYLAGNRLGPDALREEAAARARAGLHSEYLSAAQLRDNFGIARKAALVSRGNLALDPRKLTAGLLLQAAARGARFHAPVEATGFEASPQDVTVATSAGPTIRARHVVLATGYELAEGVPTDGHRVISTWAIATRPQKQALWPEQAFMWEASDPYLYLRATPDGRIICGGEDEDFSDEAARDALTPQKCSAIRKKLARLLPEIDTEPDFAWAGAFGTTGTGLPLIGTLSRKPRMFAVMGYGGNGITWSRIAAEFVCTALSGRDDSDADLFTFPH